MLEAIIFTSDKLGSCLFCVDTKGFVVYLSKLKCFVDSQPMIIIYLLIQCVE